MTRPRRNGMGIATRVALAALAFALALAAALSGGADPVYAQTTTDYDDDNDGLIDIRTLAQLDAVRHDLNGNGDSTHADYIAAFPNRDTSGGGRMGCPSGTCSGYELRADLDFDTNGNGYAAGDPGDAYYNSNAGFSPIGGQYSATFKGNGFIIRNLYINLGTTTDVGLFKQINNNARIESLGIADARVHGRTYTGILAGTNHGDVTTSWTTGAVSSSSGTIGGLIGHQSGSGAATIACYSHASVSAGTSTAGALIGNLNSGSVTASYATGTVSGTNSGGLYGWLASATSTNSYYNSDTGGAARISQNVGHNTSALQSPTAYGSTGIYSGWNVDVDTNTGNDDPWDFGTATNYPALKFGSMNPDHQRNDYDADDDGLIDVSTLAQLNALRWDLDGNGDPSSGNESNYGGAFPNRITSTGWRMGCPSGTCSGYELVNDLDFDTDGDGSTYTGTHASPTADSGDQYPSGWSPIGADSSAATRFSSTFKGNGHVIHNLFMNVAGTDDIGLFGAIHTTARIEGVGVRNAYVAGREYIGIMVGSSYGTIAASWTSGHVRGRTQIGGMVGYNQSPADIIACYSTASAHATVTSGAAWVGGLVGVLRDNTGASIVASYATGAVSSTPGRGNVSGLVNVFTAGTVTNSYFDSTTSGLSGGRGQTTSALKTPTEYGGATSIFTNWNVDVDGVTGADDPWDFGTGTNYPALKYAGFDLVIQRGDYDTDDDGLIEVSNLAQLNAIRWDLDGDAVQDTTSAADWAKYGDAFPYRDTASASRMGCPSGTCAGYELAAHLDFDTDGDGATYTGTGASAASDSGDAYHNGGAGWDPIGDDSGSVGANRYRANFKGNGYVISNLFSKRATTNGVGLFGALHGTARVESLGLANGFVHGRYYAGILAGYNYGTIVASWTTGAARGEAGVGGLAGYNANIGVATDRGYIFASYSHASAHATPSGNNNSYVGGLTGWSTEDSRINSSYSTGAVTSTNTVTIGGLYGGGDIQGSRIVNSYYDSSTSGISSGTGAQTTSALRTPTEYGTTGIYTGWNIDLDSVTGNDDPWDFGTASQYPALKYGGHDPIIQRGDYDTDDDGLIEISNLDRLNAVRWDLDGDGVPSDRVKHRAAFINAGAGMGCPDTTADADTDPGPCAGYELAADLDMDSNGDGRVGGYDAYPNWQPIGGGGKVGYSGAFDGNNYVIRDLTMTRKANVDDIGLFGVVASGSVISGVGLPDASVTTSGSNDGLRVAALAGVLQGTVRSGWATGTVTQTGTGNGGAVGGLAGFIRGGTVAASWSGVHVSSAGAYVNTGGLAGRVDAGTLRATYAIGAVSATGIYVPAGGLAGEITNGSTVASSYAIGPTTSTGANAVANAIGRFTTSTASDSFWDVGTSGIADDADTNAPEGITTSAMQSVTDYTGIFANWNQNVDGNAGNDDPWTFGKAMQYPMLKFDGMSLPHQDSLAMGMPSSNGNNPVVGEEAGVCLVDADGAPNAVHLRAQRDGEPTRKAPWVWQKSTDGKAWTDITEDGGATYTYTPVSGDVGSYLRACVALNDTAPDGLTRACTRLFAKVTN